MPQISGTVFRDKSNERIPYASVKAWKKGVGAQCDQSDDDGGFNFDDLEIKFLDQNFILLAYLEVNDG